MKKGWVILLLLLSLNAKSQEVEFQDITAYYLFNIGYTYHNISYLETGVNSYLVQPNDNIIDLGATVNLGASDGHFIAID